MERHRERPRDWFSLDPEYNIVLWAWSQVDAYREQHRAAMADPANAHLEWVHITSTAQLKACLAALD